MKKKSSVAKKSKFQFAFERYARSLTLGEEFSIPGMFDLLIDDMHRLRRRIRKLEKQQLKDQGYLIK